MVLAFSVGWEVAKEKSPTGTSIFYIDGSGTDRNSVPGILFKFLDINEVAFKKSRIFFEAFVGTVVL